MNKKFKILSLDGGGSKGVYTLGVLKEIEALVGHSLHNEFNLIYGTSTGAIIASLIALGKTIQETYDIYFDIIPKVMKKCSRAKRSKALKLAANEVFDTSTFADFKTDIGIVATHIDYARPMIFKSSSIQAHGRTNTFKPGFGSSVSDAILASCAAYPFFNRVRVETENQGEPDLMDGGFVANNPTLFAIADALKAYKIPSKKISVLSVGVGVYREPAIHFIKERIMDFWPFWLTRKIFDCNTNTIEILRNILMEDVPCVRVNDTFAKKDYETDLLESDVRKLKKMYQLGRESFALRETEIKTLLC